MPMSSNIHAYADVASVLAALQPEGGGTYKLPNPGAAVHWAQRANKYRLLLQKATAAAAGIKGFHPPTPYDRMKVKVVGASVEVDFDPQPTGEIITRSGRVTKPVDTDAPTLAAIPAPAGEVFKPKVAQQMEEMSAAAAALLEEYGDED